MQMTFCFAPHTALTLGQFLTLGHTGTRLWKAANIPDSLQCNFIQLAAGKLML